MYAPFLGNFNLVWTAEAGASTGNTNVNIQLNNGVSQTGTSNPLGGAVITIVTPANMPPQFQIGVAFGDNIGESPNEEVEFVFDTPPVSSSLSAVEDPFILSTTNNPNVLTGVMTQNAQSAHPTSYNFTLTRLNAST